MLCGVMAGGPESVQLHAACCMLQLTQAAFVGAGRCAMHAKVFVSMSKQSNVAGRGPLPSSRRMQGPAQADAVAHKLVIQLPPPWHGTPLSTARMPTPLCALLAPAAFKPCRQCGLAYQALVLAYLLARR
jgi:hypothetical protein